MDILKIDITEIARAWEKVHHRLEFLKRYQMMTTPSTRRKPQLPQDTKVRAFDNIISMFAYADRLSGGKIIWIKFVKSRSGM